MSETQSSLIGKARMANARAARDAKQAASTKADIERQWQNMAAEKAQLRAIRHDLESGMRMITDALKQLEGMD